MATRSPAAIIEEAASLCMLADAEDRESIDNLKSLFEELWGSIDAADASVVEAIGRGLAQIKDLASGVSKDPAKSLEAISACIEEIQRAQQDLPAAEVKKGKGKAKGKGKTKDAVAEVSPVVPEAIEAETSLDPDRFTLPEWVEPQVFEGFLSAQKSVLEEIESDLLRMEQGDAEAVSDFRRRIHTLKGESGIMELEDLSHVCHAIEDYLSEVNPASEGSVDRLLMVKDWVAQSLESYANGRKPHPGHEDVRSRLMAPADVKAVLEEEAAPKVSQVAAPAAGPRELARATRDDDTIMMLGEFIQESEEGLTQSDQFLMNSEHDGLDSETINSIFRTFHTIKGVAGFLELSEIQALAHKAETLLNMVRDGVLVLEGARLDRIFDATAMMQKMMVKIREGIENGTEFESIPELPTLLAGIEAAMAPDGAEPAAVPAASVAPGTPIGEVLVATGAASEEAVAEALKTQQESGQRLGEELVKSGVVEPREVAEALRAQQQSVAQPMSAAGQPAAAQGMAGKVREAIKVDADRLDRLVDMIGELVIAESMVHQSIGESTQALNGSSGKLDRQLSQLGKITRELQEMGMSLRMVPIRATFQKMARLVRDLSKRCGKHVECQLVGEDTELDKSVVDNISDPLVHMIRNAIDHGLEADAHTRREAGKSEIGKICLRAYHKGGNIHIEVEDDGRGLNRQRILNKARERGLVRDTDNLTDREVFNLIFEPGFSTADQVTEISGRGVGMDVVRRNIEALRGHVEIRSEMGKGSVFSIRLPLTLAIIDGMVVRVGEERYIIPTLSVDRSLRPERSAITLVLERGEMLTLKDQLIPLFKLSQLFTIGGAIEDPTSALVVIVEDNGKKTGIVVDELIGQQQIVIKSLGDGIKKVQGIAGGAIMADGKVGLILDVGGLVSIANGQA